MSDHFGMLGMLITLVVKVPEEMLGTLCDLAEKLASAVGSKWYEELKRFLRKEACWATKIISIDRSKPFDSTEFICKGWFFDEEDRRSIALTEVDLFKVRFKTMLKRGEESIVGEEKLMRLKKAGNVRLDAKVFHVLWEDQSLIPDSWKEKTGGNTTYIFFCGTVLQDRLGHRYILYLYWNDGLWLWDYYRLDNDCRSNYLSAVLAA